MTEILLATEMHSLSEDQAWKEAKKHFLVAQQYARHAGPSLDDGTPTGRDIAMQMHQASEYLIYYHQLRNER